MYSCYHHFAKFLQDLEASSPASSSSDKDSNIFWKTPKIIKFYSGPGPQFPYVGIAKRIQKHKAYPFWSFASPKRNNTCGSDSILVKNSYLHMHDGINALAFEIYLFLVSVITIEFSIKMLTQYLKLNWVLLLL